MCCNNTVIILLVTCSAIFHHRAVTNVRRFAGDGDLFLFFSGSCKVEIELLICRKERQKTRAEINKRVLTVAELAPLPLYFNLSLGKHC